jgi:hypothetical protein
MTYPFHLWMIRRGLIAWGLAPTTPPRGLAWYWKGMLMLLSLGLMAGVLFRALTSLLGAA